jgi:hypothetical protein
MTNKGHFGTLSEKDMKELLAQRKKDEKTNTRRKVPTLQKESN